MKQNKHTHEMKSKTEVEQTKLRQAQEGQEKNKINFK